MGVASGMGIMPLPTVTVQVLAFRSRCRACWEGRSASRTAGPAGFSLVEVLVATGLLMTAVASLAPLFVMATRANTAAGDMTTATILAAQKVEELRAVPFIGGSGPGSVDVVDSRGQALEDAVPTGGPAYLRYCDDWAVFSDDKARLRDVRAAIQEQLWVLRLRLHERKSRLRRTSEGLPWLGFHVLPGRLRLKRQSVRRFQKRLGRLKSELDKGRIHVEDVSRSVQAWLAHADHADSHRRRHPSG